MTPENYAELLTQPNAWHAVYWLGELVGCGEPRTFEVEHGAPLPAELTAPNERGTCALKTERWSVVCRLDSMDRVSFAPVFDDETDPWHKQIRAVLRCMGMPPPRHSDHVQLSLACLEKALALRGSVQDDAAQRGLSVSDLDVARLIVGLEERVIKHVRACERHCNDGLKDAALDLIEDEMCAFVADQCAKLGISPISLTFERDPRGSTVRLRVGAQHSSVIAQHRDLSIRLVGNALRGAALGAQRMSEPVALQAPVKRARSSKAAPQLPAPTVVEPDASAFSTGIDPELLQVLRAGRWDDGNVFKLPPGQLERKLYERVAGSIKMAGGKWRASRQGFVFADGSTKFASLLATGQTVDRKQFDFFWTPSELAREVVDWSHLEPGELVLEPEAGEGAIADAAAAIVGTQNVVCYELLPENVEKLRAKGYQVTQADFLSIAPAPIYDVVVMNPPFGNQADMRHIEHATRFLKPDGRLVAIMSPSFRTRASKQAESFRALLSTAGETVREIDAGAFKDAGTNVSTVMVSFQADRLPWNQESEESTDPMREVLRG